MTSHNASETNYRLEYEFVDYQIIRMANEFCDNPLKKPWNAI